MKCLLLIGLLLLGCSQQRPSANLNGIPLASSGIVGGMEVPSSDPLATSTVQVYKITASNQAIDTCTGNIIASHIVLTAAHCAAGPGEANYIYFSTTIPADIFEFFQAQMDTSNLRSVVNNVTAPAWDANGVKPLKDWHDLALLQFSGDLPPGYFPTAIGGGTPVNGDAVLIAGFGMIDGVQQIHSTDLQEATISVLDSTWSSTEILLDSSHGRASCHGDSGGPAYLLRNNYRSLIAVDSRSELASDPHFECTGNTIYTLLAPYQAWIFVQVLQMNSL